MKTIDSIAYMKDLVARGEPPLAAATIAGVPHETAMGILHVDRYGEPRQNDQHAMAALDAVRIVAEFQAKLDAAEPLAVDALAEIACDTTAPAAARVAAANALIDRKHGKPAQSVSLQGKLQFERLIIVENTPRNTIDMITENPDAQVD